MRSRAFLRGIRNNEDAIDEVLAYINGHLNQELTIQELARRASFSEYHFIRVFRDAVGMTPRSYIIAARMDYAKYLLKTTTMAVQEIGWQVGYASEGMFCNTFKRITGQTPSEYRTDVTVASE